MIQVPSHPSAKKARKSRAKKDTGDFTTNEEVLEKTPKPKQVRKPRAKKQISMEKAFLQGDLVTPVEKPKRKSRAKKSVVNEVQFGQENQQTFMPCIHTPDDLGPPSIDPITTIQGISNMNVHY